MKTIKHNLIWVSLLLIFTIGCTSSFTKDGYIRNYEAWILSLKQDYKGYKQADWSKAEALFKRYSETEYLKFKDDLTLGERQKVDQLAGQYYGLLAKYKASQVKDEIKSIMNKAKAMFQELQME